MARRRKGRNLDGVLVLNKTSGMTSNRALQQARQLFFAAKAGHTGALDPLATGVLPICFGEATKFSQFLLDADKSYRVTAQFGVSTDTQDAEGEIIQQCSASQLDVAAIQTVLDQFRGQIEQIPPMYSALKVDGKPLYSLARQGLEVERHARPVEIKHLELVEFTPGEHAEAVFEVSCTKGTYVRTLIADIGELLAVGAHVKALHRTRAGQFDESQAVSLVELEAERGGDLAEKLDHHLLSVDSPVSEIPALELEPRSAEFFMQGQAVMCSEVYRFASEGDIVRVFAGEGNFLGVAEVSDDARVLPRRLIAGHSN